MPINSLQRSAEASTNVALTRTMGAAEHAELLAAKMHALIEAGLATQETRNARELAIFERDFDKIGRLADLMAEGNYAETAARFAGISPASVRSWVAQAEKGDPRYALVAEIIQHGAAMAEAESLSHVRAAGRDPRYWAASMTFLERRYPGKWRRRTEENDAPRVLCSSECRIQR